MPAVLKALSGEEFRDVAVLPEGAELVLGRNLDVDVSIAGDPKISGSHLKIQANQGEFLLQDLNSTNGTFVNDERVTEAKLTVGSSFRCGGTEFVILDENEPPPKATVSEMEAVAPLAAATTGFCETSALDIIKRFELEDQLHLSPEADEAPPEFALRLANGEEANECVTFMAYALDKRAAVWWLIRCIEHVECLLDDNDREMFALADKWVRDPSDANRRKAMTHAEKMEMSTPSCWAGVGAFWSSGSMAPVDAPPVEPKDNLAGKAISGGVILASVFHQPEKAFDKQKEFIQIGIDVAEGKIPWDEKT